MVHQVLSDKEREMPYTDALQVICPIIFAILIFLDLILPIIPNPLTKYVPSLIRFIIFIILFAIGIILIIQSHHVIFRKTHHTPGSLIREGVYSLMRNPMYLGINLIYISVTIVSFSIVGLIIWIIFAVFIYRRMVNFEEQKLEDIFGEEYGEYKNRVPKWIPKIISSKKDVKKKQNS